MAEYSVTFFRRSFASLINKALAGERVVITRRGTPLVVLSVFAAAKRPVKVSTAKSTAI